MTDSDGISEAVEGAERILVMTAARVGETLMRARREMIERARVRDERAAAELQARYDAQRALARAELRETGQDGWWERASTDDVARAVQVAATWRGEDETIAATHARLAGQVQERYGVDVNDGTLVTSTGLEASRHLMEARAEADRRRAGATEDVIEAQMLLADATALDAAAEASSRRIDELENNIDWERGSVDDVERFVELEQARIERDGQTMEAQDRRDRAEYMLHSAEERRGSADELEAGARSRVEGQALTQTIELYDSAERRDRFADSLRKAGRSEEEIRDRLVPERDQATHPREAVRGSSRARRSPKPARQSQQDRGRSRER